jgi:16S rRNA (guanine966-N2)-methyltransferase
VADAGRVIAGRARGIRLLAPGPGTRPFGDRVKQTLFAILEGDLRGAAFLDLYSGSGAGGIEALSRGARTAVFVESDRDAARVIAENLRRTGLAGPAAIVRREEAVGFLRAATEGRDHDDRGGDEPTDDAPTGDAPTGGDPTGTGSRRGAPRGSQEDDRRTGPGPFDVVLLDPPYADRAGLDRALELLGTPAALGRLVAPGARVVAKHFWRDPPPGHVGLLASERERRFGETALTFYRVGAEGSE